ncbi:hypothetical protein BXY41_101604 [Lacrimispora xylanisolvens]|uniref:Phosphotransferase family enzyme n=1 Tax=Lacrimispora xylanisolvens TaxID=384636 RepID=A0A2S6HZP6_9FIRM|nr:hypothetical protein [Hungatella xylanolytica]PPK83540.1 hypothetical protein BXY41_101604 [Hungatella xylanolytica]
MKIYVIYDDTGRKSEVIADIIGDKGFADVVVKKKKLEEYYRICIEEVYKDVEWRKIRSIFEYADLIKSLDLAGETGKVIHCFSNYIFSDKDKALLTFKKLEYIDDPYKVMDGKGAVAAMFPSVDEYAKFCKTIISGQKAKDVLKKYIDYMNIEGLVDISIIGNFIQCITGNFESRYFNSLKGNEYTLVKSSTNKKKIKAEYSFYHLLPEDMKIWFVLPFNYQETDNSASYMMERLHMTDLSIKWVHGSMDEFEFEDLMDKYFYFFTGRHKRKCLMDEYQKIANNLYVKKVIDRIMDLKKLPEYAKIEKLLESSGNISIDALVEKYFTLKDKIEAKNQYPQISVIGHGDPCFANTMYNKSTKTLKFIDPKGALTEADLWTNAYYDVAKLSHSVCGRYDFFNNALFDIRIDGNLNFDLEIPFNNSKYIQIFKQKVEENGFDYLTVRIYEASLFLSMLPLHIDNLHKVFGFILNANNILKEIEKNV